MQNAADTQDGTHKLTHPVGDLRQVTFQPAFHLVEQGFQDFLGTIVQADWLLLVVAGKDRLDQILIPDSDTFRDWFRGERTTANGRFWHGVQEPGGKATTAKSVVAHQPVQHFRLHCQHHGQCRVDNALAGSTDAVDPDGITTVTFEEYIDIHIAAVQAADDIEDTALCGNHRRTTVVLGQNGSQLFGSHIVHEESERFHRFVFGYFFGLVFNILLGCFAFGCPLHQTALLLFQLAQFHLAFDDFRTAPFVFQFFKYFHRADHHGQHRGFSLRRWEDDDRVGVERFCPVRIAPDEVFSLAAQGHNAQSLHRRHIHRGLGGFRHRQHIAANDLRQCVHGKCGKVIFIKGDGRVPDYGAGTVVSIRWDIPGLLADFGIEPLFSCPDAFQLPILQGWGALLGSLEKENLCLWGIAVSLDDPGSDPGHGAVTAALRNGAPHVGKSLFVLQVIQKGIQGNRSRMIDDLGIFRAEQEPGGVHGVGIEKRECRQQTPLQSRIAVCIPLRVSEEYNMKPGTGAFLAFGLHVVAAVVQHIGNIGKEVCNVLRSNPVRCYLGVVIVAVPGQCGGDLKVCGVAVVVFVPGADHVCGKGQLRGGLIRDFNFVGIQAVGCVADAICRVYGDWCVFGHGDHSFLSFSCSANHPAQPAQ